MSPHPYGAGSPPGVLAWSHAINHPGAVGMWVHFSAFDLAPGDWLVVRDPLGSLVETFTDQGRQDLGAFWSQRIPGEDIVVELWSQSSSPGFGVELDAYAWAFDPIEPQGICGVNDLEDVVCQALAEPAALAGAAAVARLTVFADDGSVSTCTGFRIGCPCRFLTTAGCIDSSTEAFSALYEFDADSATCRGVPPAGCMGEGPPGRSLSGGTLLTLDPSPTGLDFALIGGVCWADDDNPYYQVDQRDPEPGQRIHVPQHAGGCFKQFGIRDTENVNQVCELAAVSATTCRGQILSVRNLEYTCDTTFATRGAPVVAHDTNRVVGMHHCDEPFRCPSAAVPILEILPLIAPFLPPVPAEVTGLRVDKSRFGADDDLVLSWNPTVDAGDYRIYLGHLPQPMTGLFPPASYGHLVDSSAIPPEGTCTAFSASSFTFRARGNWLTGDDDIYYLVVALSACGAEGPYGAAPVQGWSNPLVPRPPGVGCP